MKSPARAPSSVRARRSGALRSAVAGAGGASWAFGLARLIAEASFFTPLYRSPWAVAGMALAGGTGALLAHRFLAPSRTAVAQCVPLFLPLAYVLGVARGPLAGGVLVAGSAIVALLIAYSERAPWAVPGVLGLATLSIYLRTMLPSLGEADTFEFQVIVPKLAVAHPTGYPLYVLLTKPFTFLPFRNVAWRVSLGSAVYATGAVLLLYALVLRLTKRRLPAVVAALSFAVSSVFWSQALVAEVYALHALLLAAMLWLVLCRSIGGGDPVVHKARQPQRWMVLSLLFGLSMTNHLTTVLILPAIALVLVWDRPRLTGRQWLAVGGLLLLGLSVYAFIPLRWPALNGGERLSLLRFLEHVTGGQFRGAMRLDGWRDPVRWSIVGRLVRDSYGWGGLVLAIIGLVWTAARHRRAILLTGVVFLAYLVYGLDYYVPDISVFLIPAHLVLAVWVGAGVGAIVDLAEAAQPRQVRAAGQVLAAVLAILPLSLIWRNAPEVDLSRTPDRERWGREVLRQPLAPGAAILADVKRFAPLYYVQQIEGRRSDLDIVLLGTEAQYRATLDARIGAGQPVYLARYLPHLEHLHLRSVGPVVEVVAGPLSEPPRPDVPLDVLFGSSLRLIGYDETRGAATAWATGLALHWVAEASSEEDYVVRFRLRDQTGAVAWESDAERPVAGQYPTSAWRPGEVVIDYHELVAPTWLPPGTYSVEVGLFQQFSDDGLAVGGGGGHWAPLMDVPLEASGSPSVTPAGDLALFGRSTWLVAHDAPQEAVAGAPLGLTLSWRDVAPEAGDSGQSLMIVWRDSEGRLEEHSDRLALAGRSGLTGFQTHHIIQAPSSEGRHALLVGWVDGVGQPVRARCGWLAPEAGLCALGDVDVAPAQEGLANFADRLLLLNAEAVAEQSARGQLIPVVLHWRAQREIEEDYTVLVQLVGPDGRLHGQVDSWPVQGTFPTSQWIPGERVVDHHDVRLDADAPVGHYAIHVGWYLLATMQRLEVLDHSGQPVGDTYVIGEFEIEAPPH